MKESSAGREKRGKSAPKRLPVMRSWKEGESTESSSERTNCEKKKKKRVKNVWRIR